MEENYFSPQRIPFILCPWFVGQTADFILSYRLSCVPNDTNLQQIPTPLTKVHGEQDIVQEHNLLPFEQQQSVIVPENTADTACSPKLPEAFVDSIVEKVVERIANPFSHIPATSAAHSCPQSSSTIIVDNNASLPTNTFISGESNTPSLPGTIFTSPSLPINARVCDKIKSKILGDEFIDFGVLLSNPITEGKFQITYSSNKQAEHAMSLEPLTKTKKISMLKNWLSAFHVFGGVYIYKSRGYIYPQGALALMKYGEVIQSLAAKIFLLE